MKNQFLLAFFLLLNPSRSPYLCRRRSPNGWMWFVPSSFHSCRRRWDETNTHLVPQLHIMTLTHATLHSDVLWFDNHSLVHTHTHTHHRSFCFSHTYMKSHFFFLSLPLIFPHVFTVSHSDASGKPIVILVNPLPQKRLRFAQSFSWQKKQLPPPVLSVYSYKM